MNPPLFLASFPVTAAWTIEAVPLVAGTYYLRSTNAAESLIAQAQTKVQTVFADVTVTFADENGQVKFANSGGADRSVDLSAALLAKFGFAASPVVVPAGGSVTADYQATSVWRPNVGPTDMANIVGAAGKPVYDTVVTKSPSGAYCRTTGPTRYECPMRFRALTARKVWSSEETLTNESWQTFFEDDVLARVATIRYFDEYDDTAYTQAYYCSSTEWKATESVKNHQALWDLELEFIPVV